jgi:hypothetical protein
MANCSYSRFVSGHCGSSRDYPEDLSCLTIEKCQRDIKGHLKLLEVRDATLNTEAQLLLALAGMKKRNKIITLASLLILYTYLSGLNMSPVHHI